LSKKLGGAQIYLKREDLNHTGAHKVNNTIGQALLASIAKMKMLWIAGYKARSSQNGVVVHWALALLFTVLLQI
jgi:tryptophan synthase beta chain